MSGFFDISYYIKDDDTYNWQLLTTDARMYYIHPERLKDIRRVSRYMYITNPHYHGIIRSYIKYIAGKGVDVISNTPRQTAVWDNFVETFGWDNLFRDIVSHFFQDGEVFLHTKTYKLLNPDFIMSSGKSNEMLGIGYKNADYGNTSIEYFSYYVNGKYYKLPASDVIYIKDTDINIIRGLPYLYPILKSIKDYEKWLNDRVVLNQIRSSIVMIRKHQAQPAQVKTFVDAQQFTQTSQSSSNTSGTPNSRLFEAGTIIDTTSSTDYQFLSPNIGAHDATEDGRSLRLTFSASTGLPEYMISGDSSNSNYASTLVSESPAFREFENWQNFFTEYIVKIWRCIMDKYNVPVKQSERPKIIFQSLQTRNKLQDTQINEILYNYKIISTEEWKLRENIDR